MSFALSPEAMKRIDVLLRRYPQKPAALLPVLHIIQREKGLIPPEAVDWVAAALDIPPLQIREVLSFYTLLRRKPAGRHVIQVCRNISCFLSGGGDVVRHLETRLGIKDGETTPDGEFTLMTVECLGNCDQAPCLMINDDDYGHATRKMVDGLLERLA